MRYSIDDSNALAQLVRELRVKEGLTQQQLAVRAEVSFSFINQVERGKETLRLDVVNKILKIFGYSMMPTQLIQSNMAPKDNSKPEHASLRRKDDWVFY